jgi:hypothetical protein
MMRYTYLLLLISLLFICSSLAARNHKAQSEIPKPLQTLTAEECMDKVNLSRLLDSLNFDAEYGAFKNYINNNPPPLNSIFEERIPYKSGSPGNHFLHFQVNGQIVKDIDLSNEIPGFCYINPMLDYALVPHNKKFDLYNVRGEYVRTYNPVVLRETHENGKFVSHIESINPAKDSTHPDSVLTYKYNDGQPLWQSKSENRWPAGLEEISRKGLITWKFSGGRMQDIDFALVIQDTTGNIVYRNLYTYYKKKGTIFVSIAFSEDGEYIAALAKQNQRHQIAWLWNPPQKSNLIIYNKKFEPVFTFPFQQFPYQSGSDNYRSSMKFTGHTLILAIRKGFNYPGMNKLSKKDFYYGAVDIAQQKIFWGDLR